MNEPFEMGPAEQSSFWRDTMLVAEAVARHSSAIKMNYEIHGNTLPHLHVHLFPRHVDDPFVGGPIDPRRVELLRTKEEIDAIGRAIRER